MSISWSNLLIMTHPLNFPYSYKEDPNWCKKEERKLGPYDLLERYGMTKEEEDSSEWSTRKHCHCLSCRTSCYHRACGNTDQSEDSGDEDSESDGDEIDEEK